MNNNSTKDKKVTVNKYKVDFDLFDIITLFWSKRNQIIIITSVFIIVGLIYALLATNWYMAQVKIMPSGSKDKLSGKYSHLASLAGINLNVTSEDNYELYPDIIKSNFILDRLLEHKFDSKIFGKPVTLFEFLEIHADSSLPNWKHIESEKLKKELRANYIISDINEQNGLLTLKVFSPKEPGLSTQMANFIVDQLDIYNRKFRHYKAKDQREYIEKSLVDAKKGLRDAEKKLQIFLEENKDYSSPEKNIKYKQLSAEYSVQQSIYTDIRRELELSKISEIKDTATLNVLERAIVPIEKYMPKRSVIMILFTIIGLVVSLLYVSVVNFLSSLGEYMVKK